MFAKQAIISKILFGFKENESNLMKIKTDFVLRFERIISSSVSISGNLFSNKCDTIRLIFINLIQNKL